MKKFSKMFALMLLAGALVVGFASCSNDSSDSSNTSSSSSSSSSSGSGNSVSGSSTEKLVATYVSNDGSGKKVCLYEGGKASKFKDTKEIRKGTYVKEGEDYKTCKITVTWTETYTDETGKFTVDSKPEEKAPVYFKDGKSDKWTYSE